MNTENSSKPIMNDIVAKQMVRQLKLLNFWITFFGSLIIITLLIVGFFIFKVVNTINKTQQQFTDLKNQTTQTLNLKDDICDNNLLSTSKFCKK